MTDTLTSPPQDKLTPPPGFVYDPELVDSSYEDQVRNATEHARYQDAPLPSLEGVPRADVQPAFNPTGAPESEIYGRDRFPHDLGDNWRVCSEWPNRDKPVKMWRVVDRSKLQDGTALVASRVLQTNNLGDVENFETNLHMDSHHQGRMADPDSATPFVSFSTDPYDLASVVILKYGYGIKQGQDAVVVEVTVDPDRVITEDKNKSNEVLVIGGVSPDEYGTAYEITGFVNALVDPQEMIPLRHDTVQRDRALGHWALVEPKFRNR